MTGPSDHRGRPVGNQETSHGGHRPTPRLLRLLVHEMGRPISYNAAGAAHVRMFGGGAVPEEYREATAQNMIDDHRAGVAKGVGGSLSSIPIQYAIRNRKDIAQDMWEAENEDRMNPALPDPLSSVAHSPYPYKG